MSLRSAWRTDSIISWVLDFPMGLYFHPSRVDLLRASIFSRFLRSLISATTARPRFPLLPRVQIIQLTAIPTTFPISRPNSSGRLQPSPQFPAQAPDSSTKAYWLAIRRWCLRRLPIVAEAIQPPCRWGEASTFGTETTFLATESGVSPRVMASHTASKSVRTCRADK